MAVLITGGAGYIGSHIAVKLLQKNHSVVIIDDLSNSSEAVIQRISDITNKNLVFIKGDICKKDVIEKVFNTHTISSVMHLAGVKSVAEAQIDPLKYYKINVAGSINLLDVMDSANVRSIVFSSSATVYNDPFLEKFSEESALNPANTYGRTKLAIEKVLRDLKKSRPDWKIAILRSFNPVGAHSSGLLGENPKGKPNNLMPCIMQVAAKKNEALFVFGNDYSTPDGTCLRDYIHVEDLADGHIAAMSALETQDDMIILNLGTGHPYSVLEMIHAFERASQVKIAFKFAPRRPGDLASYYADPSLAEKILGWRALIGIDRMCEDSWRWQTLNPNGYETED